MLKLECAPGVVAPIAPMMPTGNDVASKSLDYGFQYHDLENILVTSNRGSACAATPSGGTHQRAGESIPSLSSGLPFAISKSPDKAASLTAQEGFQEQTRSLSNGYGEPPNKAQKRLASYHPQNSKATSVCLVTLKMNPDKLAYFLNTSWASNQDVAAGDGEPEVEPMFDEDPSQHDNASMISEKSSLVPPEQSVEDSGKSQKACMSIHRAYQASCR